MIQIQMENFKSITDISGKFIFLEKWNETKMKLTKFLISCICLFGVFFYIKSLVFKDLF